MINKLSQEAFEQTLTKPMVRVPEDAEPPLDIWPYVEQIPAEDFQGYDCTEGKVNYAYDNHLGTFQHVLICSDDDKVYMVIVVDLKQRQVHGHRLVNFAQAVSR